MAPKQPSISKFFQVKSPPRPTASSSKETTEESKCTPSEVQEDIAKELPIKRPASSNPSKGPEAKRPKPNAKVAVCIKQDVDSPSKAEDDDDEAPKQSSTKSRSAAKALPARHAETSSTVSNGDIAFIQGTGQADIVTSGTRVREKLTPLEEQFVAIKKANRDVVLFVECGYKFRFFGRDAEVAAKHLKIMLIQREGEPFLSASIPVQRLYFHVDRLVRLGYKVGVVHQTESAAFREASSGKPFDRQLTKIFTRATFVPDDDGFQGAEQGDRGTIGVYKSDQNRLLLIFEQPAQDGISMESNPKEVRITIVAISLTTGGAIIWDTFHDGPLRRELETRLYQLDPVEIIIPDILSRTTKALIYSLGLNTWGHEDSSDASQAPEKVGCIRLEVKGRRCFLPKNQKPTAVDFYTGRSDCPSSLLDELKTLPEEVMGCLGAAVEYLKPFKLQNLLLRCSSPSPNGEREMLYFEKFSCLKYMILPATTLKNLEIFQSTSSLASGCFGQTAWQGKGSLYWHLNRTCTPFGARLLYKWLCSPLLHVGDIVRRQDAVSEIFNGECSDTLMGLRKSLLMGMMDLERVLAKSYHLKATPAEFLKFIKAFNKVANILQPFVSTSADMDEETGDGGRTILLQGQLKVVKSPLLIDTLVGMQAVDLAKVCSNYLDKFDHAAAASNQKGGLFLKSTAFPSVLSINSDISAIQQQLAEHLQDIRKELKNPSIDYKCVSGTEYLIEVPVKDVGRVPTKWTVVSRIKACHRFHTPFIVESSKKLAQFRELLTLESEKCWIAMLQDFSSECYTLLSEVVSKLATLDCLFSLAEVAKLPGYCRPEMSEECKVILQDSRHPMVERLLEEKHATFSSPSTDETSSASTIAYVPNHVNLSVNNESCMIITGPNMGGKSCYIRQVALVVMMAQIGSWIPATSAAIGVFDAIYARMGASDDMIHGHSTFMVELQETSDILHRATKRSLVILDELGRGTSTHDGVAIAYATLEHIVNSVKCTCLFVTHYPILTSLAETYQPTVQCYYMAFLEDDHTMSATEEHCTPKVTFLYQLRIGVSPSSFGLNVARLAGIKPDVLKLAWAKSKEMHDTLQSKGPAAGSALKSMYQMLCDILQVRDTMQLTEADIGLALKAIGRFIAVAGDTSDG